MLNADISQLIESRFEAIPFGPIREANIQTRAKSIEKPHAAMPASFH
jgi:hypothetical protein